MVTDKIHQGVKAMTFKKNTQITQIWNPSVAITLGIVFTPIFSALIHASNWRALGNHEEARRSVKWAAAQFFIIILATLLAALFRTELALYYMARALPFLGLIAWGVTAGKAQIAHVSSELGDIYESKSWILPVVTALACILVGALILGVAIKGLDDNSYEDGVAIGAGAGIESCQDQSINRMRACNSFSCQIYEMRFAHACASVSDPTPSFCRAYAAKTTDAISRVLETCAQTKFPSSTCGRVLATYTNNCVSQ